MHRLGVAAVYLLPVCLLSACVPPPPVTTACPPGTEPATQAELTFGRHVDNRLRVRDADWVRFVADEITPRFPDGITVLDATGQWRDTSRNGRLGREPSKILRVVMPGEMAAQRESLVAIVDAYKARFDQQSVLTTLATACAGS